MPKVSDVHIEEKKLILLEAEYMPKAEQLWITKVQRDCFGGEIDKIKKPGAFPDNSRLKTLSSMLDEKAQLRLRSRIKKAEGIDNQKHPIVLDGRHPHVRLYIARKHERLHHASTETVINEIRQRFWALRLRTTTRDVIKGCLQCRIRKAKPLAPATGDLPIARLSHHQRPFSFIGYDYFGPLSVTVGRQHQKRYVALFTCLTTRAVHLQLAASLSAASAICALRRMIARKGCPAEIYSDNGTNFHGADNQLRREVLNAVKEEAANKCIKWHFIPAGAPFMGGAWERLVQSVKRALQTTLHKRHPTEEVLMTLLAEVENAVNSRPLTYVSCSSEDTEAITPNHFILGGSPCLQTLGTFDETDLIKRDRWRQSQQLANITPAIPTKIMIDFPTHQAAVTIFLYKDDKDIALSKFLSWILRHAAIKEGLPMSPEGYVEVDRIIQHRSILGKYNKSDIERAVSSNNKQRFKLRINPATNILEIKANQGHTINKISDAELTLVPKTKYKTVVHGTFYKFWPQIKQLGLNHMQRNHIHLARGTLDDEGVISGVRENTQIYIFIDIEKAIDDGLEFYESDNGVILTPGNHEGYLESKYFQRAIDARSGKQIYP